MQWLLERMSSFAGNEAFIWRGSSFTYRQLLEMEGNWSSALRENSAKPGEIVILEGDYSPYMCAACLALINNANIIVPRTAVSPVSATDMAAISKAGKICRIEAGGRPVLETLKAGRAHQLTHKLQDEGRPGLVLFSSGSSGDPKAVLHDFAKLLDKFKVERRPYRTIAFLALDHIGGVNTLFHTLSNGGCVVTLEKRNPESVCRAIEKHHVELLPVSPTFLNLVLISEQYRDFDLSSLKIISYGTEPMPEGTLKRIHQLLPDVKMLQTYGLSEIGVMRSQSKDSSSLWVKVGGEGYQTKVVDGILYVKAQSAMLGYLNAPYPFDANGWFNTEDEVEVDGDYLKIKGRRSDIIVVGGDKVYPAEVESVIMEMPNINEAVVRGEKNPIMGNIVVAAVSVKEPEEVKALASRLKAHCRAHLSPYKVPVKVTIIEKPHYGGRFKKLRQL